MEAGKATAEERNLSEEFDQRLKALGFDHGRPVYEVYPTFKFEAIQQALFRSKYDALPTLVFVIGNTAGYTIPVVVEMVQVVYLPQKVLLTEPAIVCWRQPDYYVRGFVQHSGFDPQARPIVVHALVQMNDGEEPTIDLAYVQVVREPSGADLDTPLRWGTEDEVTR